MGTAPGPDDGRGVADPGTRVAAGQVVRETIGHPMKSVCLCGSFRFYGDMVALREALRAQGVHCEWPKPGPPLAPQAMASDEAKEAILQHLQRMDRADLIFIFNKGGYAGNSVMMEIGYAYARRKPVYLLAPLPDPFLMSLVTGVVSIEDLMRLVQA